MLNVQLGNGNVNKIMFKQDLSEQEKIAQSIVGLESGATILPVNDQSINYMIENDKRQKWNDGVSKIEEKFADHESKLQEAADEYAKQLGDVQIMPIGNYVIVRPFKENPFQKIKVSESGIITDLGGLVPEYKRTDSGEYEEAEQFIKVGVIIEVGPECKWLKSGDTIMWAKTSEVVVPFYNFGFRLVNETRAICVINDDLNERFNLKD